MAPKLLYLLNTAHSFGGNMGYKHNYNKGSLDQIESDYYELKPYVIAFMAGLCFLFKAGCSSR